MRWQPVENEPETFALIFETGDEVATVLQQLARRQRLRTLPQGMNSCSPESGCEFA